MPPTASASLEFPAIAAPRGEVVRAASDDDLLGMLNRWGEARRQVDAGLATISGEIERRSSVAAGYAGIAQRSGDRTTEAFVSRVTGASSVDAKSIVTVGSMLAVPSPWLSGVTDAVAAGEVSVASAAAIGRNLGQPSATVAADDLFDAAQLLTSEAKRLAPEKIARLAQQLRDELDSEGVADREESRREKRFLRFVSLPSGMTGITGEADPESAAILKAAIDPLTSPRRGGPRFVDLNDRARADALLADPRTTAQLTLDVLVELIRVASHADSGRLYGSSKPAVRVHVTARDLRARQAGEAPAEPGFAWVEGETAHLSIATAERMSCSDGFMPLVFDDDGGALKLGRSQRLFSSRQRTMLAAIWGGCALEGCDRPPSWCEAHHITPWSKGGSTDVDEGILLCRHHHLLLHNNGWKVERGSRPGSAGWALMPPGREPLAGDPPGTDSPGTDSPAQPIRLVSKNPLRAERRPREVGVTVGAVEERP